MGVELDLTRHVNDNKILFGQRIYGFGEEVKIIEKEPKYEIVSIGTTASLDVTYSKQYIRPPLGPKLISSMTSSREMSSLISKSGSYAKSSAAGSRFT